MAKLDCHIAYVHNIQYTCVSSRVESKLIHSAVRQCERACLLASECVCVCRCVKRTAMLAERRRALSGAPLDVSESVFVCEEHCVRT